MLTLDKSSVVVITGASRGIGMSIANQLSPTNRTILTSSSASIHQLQSMINLNTRVYTVDFNTTNTEFLDDPWLSDAKHITVINNAGSLGCLSKIHDLENITESLLVNIRAPIHQTKYLMRKYPNIPKTIVNLSSLAALEPFDCWSLYCTGKAARDMFFRCLALEYNDVIVLNYAPGPCKTRMKDQILTEMPNVELRKTMNEVEWIDVDDSVGVLIKLLLENEFKSGSHVDYYDKKA